MLKTDVKWPEDFRYQTKSEWEPVGFFSEALCNSASFDLMLGFFSSAAINVLSYGFASFIYNGGKIRMIINDILSSDDAFAISAAHDEYDLPYFDLRNLEVLSYTLNRRDRHFFDCLAWLIRNERIDIKIVRMINGRGIAHTKCGVFSDGINKVGFEGSVNFSLSALIHNKESLSVFCDWNGPADVGRIKSIQKSFDKTFNGQDVDVEFVDTEHLKHSIKERYPNKNLSDLLNDELDLIENAESGELPNTVKSTLENIKTKVENDIAKIKKEQEQECIPHFPFSAGPRDYQIQAFEKWKDNGQKGFFAMATGTGKTVTALNCLLEIYLRLGYYKAIIVVPTVSLVDQWAKECRRFGFHQVIKICSQSPSWHQDVAELELIEQVGIGKKGADFIFIVTYSSIVKQNVYTRLFKFPKGKVLLIADEAHNMGSKQLCKLIPKIPYSRRIGLSATPKRQYDDFGNAQIAKFFGFEEGKYTFSYTMAEAIENGVLCKYYYYPHLVTLTDFEFEKYYELSTKIAKYLTKNRTDFKEDSILTTLLIKRKHIVHKAVNKQAMLRKILNDYYDSHGSLKYSLVYVPEGNSIDSIDEVSEDTYDVDEEAVHLIDLYTGIIRDVDSSVTVAKFTSTSDDRKELLSSFASGKIDVLTSMKCLDEGVDVPRSELAIFCASTGNPRQFIQRRGRILRKHKDKQYAIIHDLVVAPMVNTTSDAYIVEKNLLRSELRRVKDFAELSENPTSAILELTPIMNHYNLNLYEDNDKTR